MSLKPPTGNRRSSMFELITLAAIAIWQTHKRYQARQLLWESTQILSVLSRQVPQVHTQIDRNLKQL